MIPQAFHRFKQFFHSFAFVFHSNERWNRTLMRWRGSRQVLLAALKRCHKHEAMLRGSPLNVAASRGIFSLPLQLKSDSLDKAAEL